MTEAIDALIDQFDSLIEEGDLEAARTMIDQAIEDHPDHLTLVASKAELEIEEEHYEEGLALIDGVLERLEAQPDAQAHDDLPTFLNLKAYTAFYLGDLDASRRLFNHALRLDPELWSSLVGRATTHDRMGFLVASLLDLDHAIDIDDQQADPFALRAQIHLKRGQIDDAERDFTFAIECNSYDEESRLNLARIVARKGDTSSAIELVGPLLEEGEDEAIVAVAALLRSQLSLTLGSTLAAREDAEVAIEHWPDHPWGYLQLAACHLTGMNTEDALAALKEAERHVDNLKDVPDIFALRASAFEQQERFDQARREKAKVEGNARLPSIVYGPILNPAQNVPINPDKPIDIRNILADLFGHPERAPKGYEDALRNIVDQIPQMIQQNPGVERIQIELPEVPGMRAGARNLTIQVSQPQAKA